MTPFLQLALSLIIIISAAKIGGYLSFRLGQPAVLGELLVGILLGPSIINLLHFSVYSDQHLPEVINQMAEIGVLLLMFLAGLDLHLSDLARSSKVAGLAGTLGVIFPLVLGTGMGVLLSMELQSAIFVGLILAATSVSISAQTLMELKVIRSRVGIGLMGAAVFDDILVILGLSIFTALSKPETGGGFWGIVLVILQMLLYLCLASVFGWFVIPKLTQRIHNQPISQGLITFVFVIILLYSWLAETTGHMASITGAFLAGLWFGRTLLRERIKAGISTIAYGIFVPIFFINIGLSANARELTTGGLGVLLGMTLVAIIGKVIGAGWGASLGGFSRRESLQLGVGMMSRGEVGLIVASVGVSKDLIQSDTFSALVGVILITTLLTPLLLRWLFSSEPKPSVITQASKEGDS
jgi:Kef-type K+ transport system membrane component KefB